MKNLFFDKDFNPMSGEKIASDECDEIQFLLVRDDTELVHFFNKYNIVTDGLALGAKGFYSWNDDEWEWELLIDNKCKPKTLSEQLKEYLKNEQCLESFEHEIAYKVAELLAERGV